MKKNLLLLALTLLLNQAYAENSYYTELFGGINLLQTTKHDEIKFNYDTGYIVTGALGYYWDCGFRLEAEYAYRRNATKKGRFLCHHFDLHGKFQSSSLMANVIWDPPLFCWDCYLGEIHPFFAGGGIGYDFQQIQGRNRKIRNINEDKKGFAWEVFAGLRYPIFCNGDLSLEYKFHKGPFKHLYSHAIGIGFIYSFGLD